MQFFTTEPHACEPSSLPQYPPSKEMDAKRRDEEARRLRAAGRANGDGTRKTRTRDRPRAVPAPEANAELQANIDKRRLITHANAKSKSEKFPPPHQDGALGYPLGCSNHMEPAFEPPDPSSFSTVFPYEKGAVPTWSGPLADSAAGNQKRKHKSGRSSKQPSTARAR
jgi:cyclin-dependent kinase 12/13